MDIGAMTFAAFKEMAEKFHGYPSPGLLVGGYMVEMARKSLPEGTLFEVVVESGKCLPDAVQLLTLCSTGNNRLKVVNLGRYALSMFDKYSGLGVRVHLDLSRLGPYPEIRAWFLKEKPKAEQDAAKLLREIESAGTAILSSAPVRINEQLRGYTHMRAIGVCESCGEAYPLDDGPLCRGCLGLAPYSRLDLETP